MNHREHFRWGSVSAWNGNTAAEMGHADRYELEVAYGLRKELFTFKMLDGHKLEETKRARDLAFDMGMREAKREIRAMLEIKEPRS